MSDDDGAYVRGYYGVPAHTGGQIMFDGKRGTIIGFDGQYLMARVEGYKVPQKLHPTWRVEYAAATAANPPPPRGTSEGGEG